MSELSIFIDESGDFGPYDYRLFQTADMFCSMELIRLKMDAAALSPSELEFFGNVRDMKKNYLNPLERFRWD